MKNQSSGGKKKPLIKQDKGELPKWKYHLIIFIGGERLETDTNDIAKAILSVHPAKITNKVVVRVECGKTAIEKILFVYPARRVFNVPLAADFFAKNIILLLK